MRSSGWRLVGALAVASSLAAAIALAAPNPNPSAVTVQFAAPNYTFSEPLETFNENGGGSVSIEVTLSAPPLTPVTVHYAATANRSGPGGAGAGQDHTYASGKLKFDPKDPIVANRTSQSFTVPITEYMEVGANTTVGLALTDPGNGLILGAQSTAVLTVLAQEKPKGTVSVVSSKEQILAALSDGVYGYNFKTQVTAAEGLVPRAGKMIQRFKSSSFGINPD